MIKVLFCQKHPKLQPHNHSAILDVWQVMIAPEKSSRSLPQTHTCVVER